MEYLSTFMSFALWVSASFPSEVVPQNALKSVSKIHKVLANNAGLQLKSPGIAYHRQRMTVFSQIYNIIK